MARSLISLPYDLAIKAGLQMLEANLLPDFLLRRAARMLLSMRLRVSYKPTAAEQLLDLMEFAHSLKEFPISIHQDEANSQHYEVPAEFYKLVLGKHLKYSSSYFSKPTSRLDESEQAMLELYCERAQLVDGQKVLDLGCGWGSFSLYAAKKFPQSRITGLSNSNTQKDFIEEECRKQGITNVNIITSDINVFEAGTTYDRIVSIEMFEHMKNYKELLKKISSWMKPDALLFVHIFVHKVFAYHFQDSGDDDWMARSFFTGGTMPADGLLLYFQDDLSILNHWRVSGNHYSRTSEEWLKNMDRNLEPIKIIFAKTYGENEIRKWIAYWRTFFLAVSELFGYNNGEEWMVSHYLFKRK
uniref:Coclaurine N-methyltransferase n=1 Tax=Podophyllum peltatum TaxID=35933 RepID=A0A0B4VFR5_PODPE|nr:coclaurine N-methyltransferase [Podophyllum peltatum]